jgi:glutamate-5-semialdehyde dehydrogenase
MSAAVRSEPAAPAAVRAVAEAARRAARAIAATPSAVRIAALHDVADAIEAGGTEVLAANALDAADAREAVAAGTMSTSAYQRLVLDARKLRDMAEQVRGVAAQPEPVGRVLQATLLDDGLELRRVACPIGVVAAVFESRPDAVTQIAALTLRSANAVVLKPGREVRRTARALVAAIHAGLARGALPADAVAMVDGRADVDVLLGLDDLVDLVVPRGSQALVRHVQSRTRIPVLGHAEGVCHVFLDAAADPAMAVELVVDAKVQYPAACNAVEVVLVHRDAAPALVAPVVAALRARGVTVRGCEATRALAPDVEPADDADWRTEWGELRLAMRVVDDVGAAIAHVNEHGSHHTDAIVTADGAAAAEFLARVDSASVFHNASTRFADGQRFGLGAELGIATGKLHARGPVGLDGLTTYKYLLHGSGQRVADYVGDGARAFRHTPLPRDP